MRQQIVCDYCDVNLAQSSHWIGSYKADLCDECLQYLMTHPEDRAVFANDLDEAADDAHFGVGGDT